MTELVSQPTAAPTRKMTWAMAFGIVGVAMSHFMVTAAGLSELWLGWMDDPTTLAAVPVLMSMCAGYFVRERAQE